MAKARRPWVAVTTTADFPVNLGPVKATLKGVAPIRTVALPFHPLTPEERESPEFVEGVSCPRCHDKRSDADRERYAQRQRQVERALVRGEAHPIGRAQPKRSIG